MEFVGRIDRVFPARTGKSQRTGNPWRAVGFVFEYYEKDNDRYTDKVYLETFDDKIQQWFDSNTKVLEEGKVFITNEMRCRIGFGHHIRENDGRVYNDLRIYKMEVLSGIGGTEDPIEEMMKKDAVAGVAEKLKVEKEETVGDELPF